MTNLPGKHHASVVDQTERLIDLIRENTVALLEGLADRPKAGAKQKARDAAFKIMKANGDLYRFIEGRKPLDIRTPEERWTD